VSGKPSLEYLIVECYGLDPHDRVARANSLGANRWELVAVDRQDNWIFKRQLVVVDVLHDPPPPQQVEGPRVHRPASARRNGRRAAE
jgi:hypothetical protein